MKTIEDINKKFNKIWGGDGMLPFYKFSGEERITEVDELATKKAINNFYTKEITELLESLKGKMKPEIEKSFLGEEFINKLKENIGWNKREEKLRKDINKILNKGK